MTKTLATLAILLTSLGVAGCQENATTAQPVGPITLTPEQAEAIAKEDAQIQQEEGGAFLANQAKAKAKAKSKAKKK